MTTPPPYTISVADASTYARLGEISALAYADDPYRRAAFSGVSDDAYAHYTAATLHHAAAPPGTRAVVLHAARPETGEILGWARWYCPLQEGKVALQAEALPLPEGTDEVGLALGRARTNALRAELLGERKCYLLSGVAVAPSAQRTGVGSALVRWGCARADADGLPAFVAASRMAAPMYARHGFVVKDVSAEAYPATGLEVEQTRMVREPQTSK